MTVIRNIFLGLIGLLTLAIIGIYATGNGMLLTILWATTMGEPILRTLAVNVDPEGQPIEYGRTWFAGDRITLTLAEA